MVSADYTVHLDRVFEGPMDLLLHLVRQQEVEIHEIKIHRIVEGYLAWLTAMEELDLEFAGDFVVMAATLMAIKSRSLLPTEEVDLAEELDPRDELIQRLIEYRRFKQVSGELGERFEERSKLYKHGWRQPDDDEPTLDVSELSHWDLFSAFSRLMRETLAHRAMRIEADERPLRYYVERMVGWVKQRKSFSLRELVEGSLEEGAASKPLMIGSFCALLELMKLGVVSARQEGLEILITMREDLGEDLDDVVRLSGLHDEAPSPEPAQRRGAAAQAAAPES